MTLKSINPTNGQLLAEYQELNSNELELVITRSQASWLDWRLSSFETRSQLFIKLSQLFTQQRQDLARLMALEMGKPLASGLAEVDKCVWTMEYYAREAEVFLADEIIDTGTYHTKVVMEPMGIILAVMPWNFPLWQVVRFAAPALMAGNVGLLKHASNVSGVAIKIEQMFIEAGFPIGVFQSLLIRSDKVESVVRDPRVRAVALTGSERAGREVAKIAVDEVKKTVLELGSNDPFIVLDDADIPSACESGVMARLQNNGQSCIAAKRFIVVASRYDEFLEKYRQIWSGAVIGDPLEPATTIGPLVNQKAVVEIERQVTESVAKGAKVLIGGFKLSGEGFYYQPTILTDVVKGMPAYDEEIFGPVASVIKVADEQEAIAIANDSPYGLGASVWTTNLETVNRVVSQLITGAVFVNSMVKSDPRVPFGGVKRSGYGRELGSYGIKEFVNIKTVWIDHF